jgi:hypothetical protein
VDYVKRNCCDIYFGDIVILLVIRKSKIYIYIYIYIHTHTHIISEFIWYIKQIYRLKRQGRNKLKSVRKVLDCSSQIRTTSKLFRNLQMHPEMSAHVVGGEYGIYRAEMTSRRS